MTTAAIPPFTSDNDQVAYVLEGETLVYVHGETRRIGQGGVSWRPAACHTRSWNLMPLAGVGQSVNVTDRQGQCEWLSVGNSAISVRASPVRAGLERVQRLEGTPR